MAKLFSKKNIYNTLFMLLLIYIGCLFFKKYFPKSLLEKFSGLDNAIGNNEGFNANDPSYYENGFDELNRKYIEKLQERHNAYVNYKTNLENDAYEQTYRTKDSELNMINAEFQSLFHEFIIDSGKVKQRIKGHDENITELIDENKNKKHMLDRLEGSDLTARKLYSDYVLNYNNSYKTIIFSILSIAFFVFVIVREVKFNSGIMDALGNTNPTKQIIKTLTIASIFAVVFVFVYNLIVGLLEDKSEKKVLGEEPEIYKMPSYSLSVNFIDRTKEDDE